MFLLFLYRVLGCSVIINLLIIDLLIVFKSALVDSKASAFIFLEGKWKISLLAQMNKMRVVYSLICSVNTEANFVSSML